MASLTVLLTAYILGGFTFLPLALLVFFTYSLLTLPKARLGLKSRDQDLLTRESTSAELKEKLEKSTPEHDVAAGYFAVCREYVPGGINGKPPDRTTPAGETIAAESPSVYQSMYRSIFERKTPAPTIEGGKAVKKARNVFFVVLRHGHLMLFDNVEQTEVRYVIALSLYGVDLYGGGKTIQEGELYIKRNCIRLRRLDQQTKTEAVSQPFYFFSENSSDKEDFYHAIVQSQASTTANPTKSPTSQSFDTEDMIKLIRTLHLSEENIQTRWLNALIGRLFLALYKTPETEQNIRAKITKKIDRAPKPNFITSLKLEDIDMGQSAPSIVNPRLKEMNVDGGLTLEADIKYNGNFRAVIAAVARVELGSHFKPRSVNLMLAGILRRLDGHLLIRVKPPPSNRLWVTFETMPKLELTIEPIVSSKQITYSIILRAIESRIREVMSETIVLPNWDDIPFTDTDHQTFRGGIWHHEEPKDKMPNLASMLAQHPGMDGSEAAIDGSEVLQPVGIAGRTLGMPPLGSDVTGEHDSATDTKSPVDVVEPPHTPKSTPRLMRSPSNNITVVRPVVTLESPTGTGAGKEFSLDAASVVRDLNMRSQASSPVLAPNATPVSITVPGVTRLDLDNHTETTFPATSIDLGPASEPFRATRVSFEQQKQDLDADARSISTSIDSNDSADTASSARLRSLKPSTDRRAAINNQLETAKKWGLNVLSRQTESWKNRQSAAAISASTGEPYGRGHPLPPPGQPLPQPESPAWTATALNSLKRRSIPPPLPPRVDGVSLDDVPPPPLPPRDSVRNTEAQSTAGGPGHVDG